MDALLLPQVVAPCGVFEDSVIPVGGGVSLRAVSSTGLEVARMTAQSHHEYNLALAHLEHVLAAWEAHNAPAMATGKLSLVRDRAPV